MLMPIIHTLKTYNTRLLSKDLIAAFIVTMLLIPQSLAYAMLAGLPPVMGLYASILPLCLYALFGSSHALSVGPVAISSLMTATALSEAASLHGIDWVSGAVTLAFLSGIFTLALGVMRFGFLANLLSHPVVTGFISASAITIALSQVKHLMGVKAGGHNVIELTHQLYSALNQTHLVTLIVGLLSLVFLMYGRSSYCRQHVNKLGIKGTLNDTVLRLMPVILILVTLVFSFILNLSAQGVATVGNIPHNAPSFSWPEISFNSIKVLYVPALLISMIGYVESISIGKNLAQRTHDRINPNQELIALGFANIGSSISGGFPVTGGVSRSIVNYNAGAKTQMASIFTAVGVLLATLYLYPIMPYLPKVTLACTIIIAVISAIKWSHFLEAWSYSKAEFAAIIFTCLLTLFINIEAGLVGGVLASISLYLAKTTKPHIAEVGRVPDTEHFRNVLRHDVETTSHILSIRPDENLYFMNIEGFMHWVNEQLKTKTQVRHIVIQCTAINDVDLSAIMGLESLNAQLKSESIQLHLSEVKGPLMDKIKRSALLAALTGEVFLSQHQAYETLIQEK